MAELDTLEIKIESNAESAQKSIKGLANAVKKLSTSLSSEMKNVDGFTKALEKIKIAADGIDTEAAQKISALADAAAKLSKANIGKTVSNIKKMSQALSVTNQSIVAMNSGFNGTSSSAGGAFNNINDSAKQAIGNIKLLTSGYNPMVKAEQNDWKVPYGSKDKDTTNPYLSEMRKVIDSFKAGFNKGMFNGIKEAIPQLDDLISKVTVAMSSVKNFGLTLGEAVGKQAVEALKKVLSVISEISKKLASSAIKTVWNATPIKKFTDSVSSAAKSLKNMASSLARIGMYRILRTLFKDVSSDLSDAIEQLYKFDQGVGQTFSNSMDQITQSTQDLKASIGTLAANVINLITPALTAVLNLVTRLVDGVSQLMAVLGGNVFYKATASAAKYGDTISSGSSATKEWKNQLLGFDEINKLTDESSSGSGGGSSSLPIDYQEVKELPDWLKKIQNLLSDEQWYAAGHSLASHLNDILNGWDAKSWGESLGDKIERGFEFAFGFLSNTSLFATAGKKLSDAIRGVINKINPITVGKTMAQKINSAFVFARSLVSGLKDAHIGTWLANLMNGWFEQLDAKSIADTIIDTFDLALSTVNEFLSGFSFESVTNKLTEFLTEIDWEHVTSEISNGVINLLGEINRLLEDDEWKNAAIGSIESAFRGIKWAELFSEVIELAYNAWVTKWQMRFAAFFGVLESLFGTSGEIVEEYATPVSEYFDQFAQLLYQSEEISDSVRKELMEFGLEAENLGLENVDTTKGYSEEAQKYIQAITESYNNVTEASAEAIDETGKIIDSANEVTESANQIGEAIDNAQSKWNSDWGRPKVAVPKFELMGKTTFSSSSGYTASVGFQYMAKGGVVDKATPIIAGEAGKEAIVPLENNTEWIDSVAKQISEENGAGSSNDVVNAVYTIGEMIVNAVNSKDINSYIDGRKITEVITGYQKRSTRAMGV